VYTNGDRPLHFGFVRHTDGKKMLIASEAEMLYWLAKRNKMDMENDEILVCKKNHLYTFDADDKDLRKYKSEVVVPRSFFPNRRPARSFSPSGSGRGSHGAWGEEKLRQVEQLVDECIKAAKQNSGAAPQPAPQPAPLSLVPKESPATTTTRMPTTTPEEHKRLIEVGIKPGTEVTFEAEKFTRTHTVEAPDGTKTELGFVEGVILFEDEHGVADLARGVARNATATQSDIWLGRLTVAKVTGAFLQPNADGKGLTMVYVITNPTVALTTIN
jgi:plastocyanin